MSGESAGERWSPVQRVESVLLSIVSLLDDAETASPANVDAGVLWRTDAARYRARVKEDVEKSREDIPPGFVMPTHESTMPKAPEKAVDDREFWVDSDEDDDEDGFGGSDTDEDDVNNDDDEEGMDQEEVEMMEDREDEDEDGEHGGDGEEQEHGEKAEK